MFTELEYDIIRESLLKHAIDEKLQDTITYACRQMSYDVLSQEQKKITFLLLTSKNKYHLILYRFTSVFI